MQVTDRPDLAEWSIYPSPDGRFVYFTAGTGAWRVDLDDFSETQLADFGAVEMREKGMVGAAMGTTALSAGGDWWAIPVKSGKMSRFVADRHPGRQPAASSSNATPSAIRSSVPDDDNLILYAGPLTDRVWTVARDGAENRRLYAARRQDAVGDARSLVPGRRAVAFVDWPRGMRLIDIDTGKAEWLHRFPAWHAAPDASGTRFVCDTNFPDRGLHINRARRRRLNSSAPARRPRKARTGRIRFPTTTARSRSKRASIPIRIHVFRRTAKRVVFTSDRSGHAQIYEVELDGKCGMKADAPLESQRIRAEIRAGRLTGTSRGLAHGFVQVNLAIMPKAYAFDFMLYCQRNQRACPVLEVLDAGDPVPHKLAPQADLRTDCARYSVFVDGERQQDRTDIRDLWRDDLVSFLIGSGITFDDAFERAGVPTDRDRWVLRTDRADRTGGAFQRRPDRHHALADAATGDYRHTSVGAFSVQSRRADPCRRSRRNRRRPCASDIRRPGAGNSAR